MMGLAPYKNNFFASSLNNWIKLFFFRWRDLFSRSTDLRPHCLEDGGGPIDSHGLFVETTQVMDQFFNNNPTVAR